MLCTLIWYNAKHSEARVPSSSRKGEEPVPESPSSAVVSTLQTQHRGDQRPLVQSSLAVSLSILLKIMVMIFKNLFKTLSLS